MKTDKRISAACKKSLTTKSILMLILLGIVPLLGFGIVALANMNAIQTGSAINCEPNFTAVVIAFAVSMAASVLLIVIYGFIIAGKINHPTKTVINTFGDLQDITIQKKLEEKLNEQNRELQEALEMLKSTQLQMVQQERLAAIGQLAAGVAHEINNPLGYVSGNADMLKIYVQRYESVLKEMHRLINEQQPGSPCCVYFNKMWDESKIDMVIADMPDLMNDITEGLKRIAAIVNGLRGFSRNNLVEGKSTYDLNEGIKTTLLVANNEIKYNCDVNLELMDVPPVYANGGQINQVLLNIIINACHAIRTKFNNEKGLITIKTHSEGGIVFCTICDNGCGMPEEVKNRIFEPFFTTKPVGQGTGLGLGIVYDIICKQHEGSIDVTSSPGEGTCFQFALAVKRAEIL